MHGIIHQAVADYFRLHYNEAQWQQVLDIAGLKEDWTFTSFHPDSVMYGLTFAGAKVLNCDVATVLEAAGKHFVPFICAQGYDKLLRTLGANIVEFLNNLNNLHLHLTFVMPALVAPSFRCAKISPYSMELHYRSTRQIFGPFLVGLLKGSASVLFDLPELDVELIRSPKRNNSDHEVYLIRYPYQAELHSYESDMHFPQNANANAASSFSLGYDLFNQLFPFHLVMDRNCRLVQCGAGMQRMVPSLKRGVLMSDHMKVQHPYVPWDFDTFAENCNSSFLLQAPEREDFPAMLFKGQMIKTNMPSTATPNIAPPTTSQSPTQCAEPGSSSSPTSTLTQAAAAALVPPPPPPRSSLDRISPTARCPFSGILAPRAPSSAVLTAPPPVLRGGGGSCSNLGLTAASLLSANDSSGSASSGATTGRKSLSLTDGRSSANAGQKSPRVSFLAPNASPPPDVMAMRNSVVDAGAGGQEVLLFLASPQFLGLDDMMAHKLFLSDIPLHDKSRDLVLMNQHRQAESDLKQKLLREQASKTNAEFAQMYL